MHIQQKFYLYTLLLKTAPSPDVLSLHLGALDSLYRELMKSEYWREVEELNRAYLGEPPMTRVN